MVIGEKTYPEKTPLYHFHAEKALFKGPKSAILIFGLEITPPPLLELFQKFISFGGTILPLPMHALAGVSRWL